MPRRIISSLSTCDLCGRRHNTLYAYGNMELCSGCKSNMQSAEPTGRERNAPAPKESAGFGPRWKVQKGPAPTTSPARKRR